MTWKTRFKFRIPGLLRFMHLNEVLVGALALAHLPSFSVSLSCTRDLCTQKLKCPSDVPPAPNTAAP